MVAGMESSILAPGVLGRRRQREYHTVLAMLGSFVRHPGGMEFVLIRNQNLKTTVSILRKARKSP